MSCLHVESVVESTVQSIGGIIGGEKNMCVSLLKNGNEGCGWSGFGRTLRLRNLFFSAAVVFLFFVGWLLQWKSTDRGVVALVDAALDGVLLEAVGKRWSVMCVVPTSCYLAFRSCSDASMLCTCSMRAGSSYSRSVCAPVLSTYLDADAAGPSALFGDHSQERASRCCPEAEVRVFGLGATHV